MIPVRVARVVQGLRWLMALYVCGLRGGWGKGALVAGFVFLTWGVFAGAVPGLSVEVRRPRADVTDNCIDFGFCRVDTPVVCKKVWVGKACQAGIQRLF